jgi:hypothetical protein
MNTTMTIEKGSKAQPVRKLPTIKVESVTVVPGALQLNVTFSDGTSGTADFTKLVLKPPFDRIQKRSAFAEAYVDHGAVEWPTGVGIATEALYAMVHKLPQPKTLEDALRNEKVKAQKT